MVCIRYGIFTHQNTVVFLYSLIKYNYYHECIIEFCILNDMRNNIIQIQAFINKVLYKINYCLQLQVYLKYSNILYHYQNQ